MPIAVASTAPSATIATIRPGEVPWEADRPATPWTSTKNNAPGGPRRSAWHSSAATPPVRAIAGTSIQPSGAVRAPIAAVVTRPTPTAIMRRSRQRAAVVGP